MSKDKFTFYDYITNYSTSNIESFKTTFKDEIEKLPQKVVSSKFLINHLNLNTTTHFVIFNRVFMDYFRIRLNN